jgi:DNA-directed RNA polymerase specialized sigma24 family protein
MTEKRVNNPLFFLFFLFGYTYISKGLRMRINIYLQKHYNEITQKVRAVTKNHQSTLDLLNDCIVSLLEKGEEYTDKLLCDGKVQHYIIKMAYIQFNSSTSPFHLKYRNKHKLQEYDTRKHDRQEIKEEVGEDIDALAGDIKLYIGRLPVYERTLAEKHFIDGISQRKMSSFYSINRKYIKHDLDNIQSNIKLTFNRDKYKNDDK